MLLATNKRQGAIVLDLAHQLSARCDDSGSRILRCDIRQASRLRVFRNRFLKAFGNAGRPYRVASHCSDISISPPITSVATTGNTGMIRRVKQIGELLNEATVREDWYVIGSTATLEHNVERQAFDIAQSVAERLGVPLVEWTDHDEEVVGPAILYVDRDYWGKCNRKQVLDGDYELVSPELTLPHIGSSGSSIRPSPSS